MQSNEAQSLIINGHNLQIELAETALEKYQGLSGRTTLCANCGMLFRFEPTQKTAFVMRDMKFALDMIGIREGRVVAIDNNCQPETGPDFTIYQNKEPVDYVLELNAGSVEKFNIRLDDQVTFN